MRNRRIAVIGTLLVVALSSANPAAASESKQVIVPQAVGAASTFVPLSPARVLDTRSGIGAPKGRLESGAIISVAVAGHGGVPSDASSVVLNVTAVAPEQQGYLTLFPSGTTKPGSSSVNFAPNATVPNLVISRVGVGGAVSLFASTGKVDVIFDVTGYFREGVADGAFFPLVPKRAFDTRSDQRVNGAVGKVGPGGILLLSLSSGTPDATHEVAVLLNVTATNTTAGGYASVYPAGEDPPNASNLNFVAGQTVANSVIVKLGVLPGGGSGITIFNSAGTSDFLVDLVGVFDDGTTPDGLVAPTAYVPLDQPVRAYDTRVGLGQFGEKEERTINVAGYGGAPSSPFAVVGNLTVTNTSGVSYLTTWPAGRSRPTVSSVNWTPGTTVANFAGVASANIGPNTAAINVYNDAGKTDVIYDITGYFYLIT